MTGSKEAGGNADEGIDDEGESQAVEVIEGTTNNIGDGA